METNTEDAPLSSQKIKAEPVPVGLPYQSITIKSEPTDNDEDSANCIENITIASTPGDPNGSQAVQESLVLLQNDPDGPVLPGQIGQPTGSPHPVSGSMAVRQSKSVPVVTKSSANGGPLINIAGMNWPLGSTISLGNMLSSPVAISNTPEALSNNKTEGVNAFTYHIKDLTSVSNHHTKKPQEIPKAMKSTEITRQSKRLQQKKNNPPSSKPATEMTGGKSTVYRQKRRENAQLLSTVDPYEHNALPPCLPDSFLVSSMREIMENLKQRGSVFVNNNAIQSCPFLRSLDKNFPAEPSDSHNIIISQTDAESDNFKVTSSFSNSMPVKSHRHSETIARLSAVIKKKHSPEKVQIKSENELQSESVNELMGVQPPNPISVPLSNPTGNIVVKSEDRTVTMGSSNVTGGITSSHSSSIQMMPPGTVPGTSSQAVLMPATSGQPVQLGQLVQPGQPGLIAQPVPTGQPLLPGQPVLTGQPVKAGQPVLIGQPVEIGDQYHPGQVGTLLVDSSGNLLSYVPPMETLAKNNPKQFAKFQKKELAPERGKKKWQCYKCFRMFYSKYSLKKHQIGWCKGKPDPVKVKKTVPEPIERTSSNPFEAYYTVEPDITNPKRIGKKGRFKSRRENLRHLYYGKRWKRLPRNSCKLLQRFY